MDFFLKFTLISYASIFFFVIGLRLALFHHFDLSLSKLVLIFIAVSIPLSLTLLGEPLQDRLFVSAVWTSAIGIGYRFGRKMNQKNCN